ncbi:MAG: methyl-accepting chemotaxis protein [Clostridiales bacterium]|nr:methyl-accepting chemotaxis protein [Clostridiales bacterium]
MTDAEKSLYTAMREQLASYRSTIDLVLEDVANNDFSKAATDSDAAASIRADSTVAIDQLIEELKNHMNQDMLQDEVDYANVQRLMIAIVVISFIFAVLLGSLITWGINAQIKKALKVAQSLGEGDLSVQIENPSKDEIGLLLRALNKAIGNLQLLLSEMSSSIVELSANSEEVTATAEGISQRMTIVNQSAEEISSASEDLSATV